MLPALSDNTKAILLLTAPLLVGRAASSVKLVSASQYHELSRKLRKARRKPADLLTSDWREILKDCVVDSDLDRIGRLLDRGFLLTQAVERWQTRSIWVVSRADAGYPQRLKKRLQKYAPPILYGCGDAAILDTGGLAVVGSRKVNDTLVEYAERVGCLAAGARQTLVSGGARGIDQAGMRGALEAGGYAAGVLGDGLERAVTHREHRDVLMTDRLVLICPYDPAVRFHVGYAMQRNKLIYGLADAALVVSSDYGKGGTWTGAVEQLNKLKLVRVFVRDADEKEAGLRGLRNRGALVWPNPSTSDALEGILAAPMEETDSAQSPRSALGARDGLASSECGGRVSPSTTMPTSESEVVTASTPADELFSKVKELVEEMVRRGEVTEADVAGNLQVSKRQARKWLDRLVEKSVIRKAGSKFTKHSGFPLLDAKS